MSEIRRLAIFCGSNPGARSDYMEATRSLGKLLSERGIGVVYGGSNVGLMSALADTMLDELGDIIGVIPRMLVEREVAGYFDPLLEFLDRAVAEKFVREVHRGMVVVESDPAKLLARFEAYEPPRVVKWINAGTI